MTVAYLAAQVDVVLMDLRGFTPASRGCTFEIGMLLNSVSVPLRPGRSRQSGIGFVTTSGPPRKSSSQVFTDRNKKLESASQTRKVKGENRSEK
jgi:hypothetical protein